MLFCEKRSKIRFFETSLTVVELVKKAIEED